MSLAKDNRPLSPHLSVYRWQITNTLSILHRMTGLALTFGSALLVAWLWTAAFAPHAFVELSIFIRSPFGLVLMFGWSVAFYYHLANGLRHLFWDAGIGLALPTVTRSGIAVVVFTSAATAATWFLVFSRGVI